MGLLLMCFGVIQMCALDGVDHPEVPDTFLGKMWRRVFLNTMHWKWLCVDINWFKMAFSSVTSNSWSQYLVHQITAIALAIVVLSCKLTKDWAMNSFSINMPRDVEIPRLIGHRSTFCDRFFIFDISCIWEYSRMLVGSLLYAHR